MASTYNTITAILFFILCIVVNHAYHSAYDNKLARRFGRDVIYQIKAAFENLIFAAFQSGTRYPRGNMIWGSVYTTAGTVVIRLLLMSGPGRDPIYCQANPDPTDTEDGAAIAAGFMAVLRASLLEMALECSSAALAEDGPYFIAYYLRGVGHGNSVTKSFFSHSTGLKKSTFPATNGTFLANAVPADQDCDTFRSMLQSGYKGMPGSFIVFGESLYSPNSRYLMTIMPGCYIALFYVNPQMEIWRSANELRDGHVCDLHLQEDGNLVLLDGDDPVWASNAFCTPQPDCEAPSFATLQDDCNLVVYRCPGRATDPVAAWSSETEHCGL